MLHLIDESSNVHLISRLIFLESKVVFLSSLTRQLQSQNRQLQLKITALTLRTPRAKEHRLTSPSSTPIKSCPPPSPWLSPGKAQAQAQDAAAESHVQAPPFLGSCAGSVSTGKVLAPDGSNDVTLAAAQVSMPAGNGRITPSPVPPPNPPNTPATEAAAAPCLTPVRIQLLDQLLDLGEGEEERADSEGRGEGEALHMYSNPMFASSEDWGTVKRRCAEPSSSSSSSSSSNSGSGDGAQLASPPGLNLHSIKDLHSNKMETKVPLLLTHQPMPAICSLPGLAIPSLESPPPQLVAAGTAAEAIEAQAALVPAPTAPAAAAAKDAEAEPAAAVPAKARAVEGIAAEAQAAEEEAAGSPLKDQPLPQHPSSHSRSDPAAAERDSTLRLPLLEQQPPRPPLSLSQEQRAAAACAPLSEPTWPLPLSSHCEADQAAVDRQLLTHHLQPSDPEAEQVQEAAAAVSQPHAGYQAALPLSPLSKSDQEAEAANVATAAAAAGALSLEPLPEPPTQAHPNAEKTSAASTVAAAPAASLPTPQPPSAGVVTATAAATALISATWSRILSGNAALQSLPQGPPMLGNSLPTSHTFPQQATYSQSEPRIPIANHASHTFPQQTMPATHFPHASHVIPQPAMHSHSEPCQTCVSPVLASDPHSKSGSFGQDLWHSPSSTPGLVQASMQTAQNQESSSGTDTLSALPGATEELRRQQHKDARAEALFEHGSSQAGSAHTQVPTFALSLRRSCTSSSGDRRSNIGEGEVLLSTTEGEANGVQGSIHSRSKTAGSKAHPQPSKNAGTVVQQPAWLEQQPSRASPPSIPIPPYKALQDLGFASALEVALSQEPLYPDHAKLSTLQPPSTSAPWQPQNLTQTQSRHKLPRKLSHPPPQPLVAQSTLPTASNRSQHAPHSTAPTASAPACKQPSCSDSPSTHQPQLPGRAPNSTEAPPSPNLRTAPGPAPSAGTFTPKGLHPQHTPTHRQAPIAPQAAAQHLHTHRPAPSAPKAPPPQKAPYSTRTSLPPRPRAQPTHCQEDAVMQGLGFHSNRDTHISSSSRGAAAMRPSLSSSTRTRTSSTRASSAAQGPLASSSTSSNNQKSRSRSAQSASAARDTRGSSVTPRRAETGGMEVDLQHRHSTAHAAGRGCHQQPLQPPELGGMLQQGWGGQQMCAQEGQQQQLQQQQHHHHHGPSSPPQHSDSLLRPPHHISRIPRPPSSGSSSTQQGLAIPRHPTGSPCCLAQGPSLISPADAGSLCSLGRWESADDFEGQAHGAFKIDSRCSSDPDILAWLQDSLTT